MNKIYLICGVPGSGKTWVLDQLKEDHKTIHYDRHFNTPRADYANKLLDASKLGPVIADCPLGISEIVNYLYDNGGEVTPLFIVEKPDVVTSRYFKREGKSIPKQHLGRIDTIKRRAKEYSAFSGTSKEVLEHLRGLLK